MLPKALKCCQKSNKLPNLVTLQSGRIQVSLWFAFHAFEIFRSLIKTVNLKFRAHSFADSLRLQLFSDALQSGKAILLKRCSHYHSKPTIIKANKRAHLIKRVPFGQFCYQTFIFIEATILDPAKISCYLFLFRTMFRC